MQSILLQKYFPLESISQCFKSHILFHNKNQPTKKWLCEYGYILIFETKFLNILQSRYTGWLVRAKGQHKFYTFDF